MQALRCSLELQRNALLLFVKYVTINYVYQKITLFTGH